MSGTFIPFFMRMSLKNSSLNNKKILDWTSQLKDVRGHRRLGQQKVSNRIKYRQIEQTHRDNFEKLTQ